MSFSLDVALYLREQKLEKKLSLSERGLLFTLLFRVGSNPYAWVSQKTLAIELDLDERCVRRLMKKIEQKGFIQIGKDHKDKRKLLYRPADFMINYHQNPNRKVTKKYVDKSKDTGQNYPVLLGDTGQNYPVNTGQNYPVLLDEKNAQSHVPSSVAHDAKPPKGKGKVTSKAKVKPNSPNNNFLNREKHGQILTKRSFTFSHDDYDASKRQNFHLQPCFNKFIDHIKSKQGHDQFILPEWEAWRAKERGMNKNKRYGGSY